MLYQHRRLWTRWGGRHAPQPGGLYVSNLSSAPNIATDVDLRNIKKKNPELYQGDVERIINGQVRFKEGDGNYVITLLKTANLSTLAHEIGIVYFLEMQRTVENGLADESMQKDYGNLCAYAELNKTKDSNGIINLAVSVFAKNSEDTGEPYNK